MKEGSKGDDVFAWQTFLVKRKLFNGTPEGTFGGFTAKATKAFQAEQKLAQSGIVDEATLKVARALGFTLPSAQKLRPAVLTKKDIDDVAASLGIAPAAVRSVCVVESSGGGFLPDGRPKIRFEGHIFWKELVRRSVAPEPIAKANPTLCFQEYTRAFYKDANGEWERLIAARSIHREAANASASWGMFQIMGFNFQNSGYESVNAYIQAISIGEREQLQAFASFIKAQGYIPLLKAKNWLEFAKKYNGPRYIENKYDAKLADAYSLAVKDGYKE